MNPIAILSIFAAAAFPFMGGIVLHADLRACGNRIFAIMCLLMTYWSIFAALSVSAHDHEHAFFWFRVSSLGWTVIPPFMFRLFREIADAKSRLLEVIQVVLYLLGALFFALTLYTTNLDSHMVQTPLGWSYVVPPGILPWTYDLFVAACILPGLWMVFAQGRRSGHPAVRARSRVVVGVSLVTMLLLYGGDRLLHNLRIVDVVSLSHLAMVVWLAGIGYAVARYRLFSITAEQAAGHIVETMAESLLMLDGDERIVRVNGQAEVLLGLRRSDLVGGRLEDALGRDVVPAGGLRGMFGDEEVIRDRELVLTQGGARRVVALSAAAVRDRFGHVSGHVLVMRDITHRKRTEEQLQHMATHDELTGLPNRRLLHDRFGQAIAHARRYGGHIAVMIVDLDHFKEINDTLGHEAGDTVLAVVAGRLLGSVRDSDTVARLGGDEFVVLATDLPDPRLADRIVERLAKDLGEPVDLEAGPRRVTASIGVGIHPLDGDDVDELLASADRALYLVKERGRDGWAFHREVEARKEEARDGEGTSP